MDVTIVLLYVYVFIIGICIASFINVVIWRLPQGISIAKGRSYCPTCGRLLTWKDLIPICSYLFLKGKCRFCKTKIAMRDTILEFFGGLVAIFCFYQYQCTMDSVLLFSICMILLAISIIDMDTMTIPNGLIISFAICVLIHMIFHSEIHLITRLLGFFSIALPMYVFTRAIPDCFGGGDIKLIAIAGLLLGWQKTLLSAFIAVMIAGSYALFLLASKRCKKNAHIAFGPYLCIGIIIAHLYGIRIISLYVSLLEI